VVRLALSQPADADTLQSLCTNSIARPQSAGSSHSRQPPQKPGDRFGDGARVTIPLVGVRRGLAP
jgi:hypothetical protein